MQNVNFYDRSLRLRRDWLSAEPALLLLAALLLVLLVTGLALRWQARLLLKPAAAAAAALEKQQGAVTALARRVSGLRPDAALEQRLLAMQATLEQRQAAMKMLGEGGLGSGGGHAAALLALARQSIDGLWLTGVVMENGDLALRGRALRPELIATYVGRLNGESALRGHAFRALDIRRPLEDTAPAAPAAGGEAPAALPGAPASTPGAAARLAPYVEFSLVGARGAVAGAAADAAVAEGRR